MSMRALWLARADLERRPGGDTTQLLETRAALERLGVRVQLYDNPAAPIRDADVVHLWHLDRLWETLPACRRAQEAKVPAVLSTIYWSSPEFDRLGRTPWQRRLVRRDGADALRTARVMTRWRIQRLMRPHAFPWEPGLSEFRAGVRTVLDAVSVILPNSHAELEQITSVFGPPRAAVVVPNAVDPQQFCAADVTTERRGVLCVGRIEPRKNQLNLVRALRDMDEPLDVVGRAGRFNFAYAWRCRRSAGPRTRFLGPRSPAQLAAQYRQARVHACVSWYETPGLASLEAAAAGCSVVVTPGGCTREYFGDDAFYCQPDDLASIRRAVDAALNSRPSPALAKRVAADYTWENAARQTLEAYEIAVGAGA
jgi:glycosyltransferase involved in cell wall biosynthesis